MAQHYESLREGLNRMGEASAVKVDHLREAMETRIQEMRMKSVMRDQRVDGIELRLESQERSTAELDRRMEQIDNPSKRAARKNEEMAEIERTVAVLVAREVRKIMERRGELEGARQEQCRASAEKESGMEWGEKLRSRTPRRGMDEELGKDFIAERGSLR
jgi:hypothetical protein